MLRKLADAMERDVAAGGGGALLAGLALLAVRVFLVEVL